jgi:hypothetical protein
MFNFSLFFKHNSFNDLDISDKEIFNVKLKDNFNKDYLLVWLEILIFFVNNYSLINIVLKEFKEKEIIYKFKIYDRNLDDDLDEDISREQFKNIKDDKRRRRKK